MLIGLVGHPSSGKSTFFKAATLIDVAIAAYPFTTIEPNKGTGFVRVECVEKEFKTKCNPRIGYCDNGIRYVPVEIIDVAGLVPGAHEGKGLGNQFLNDLNQADVLINVIDVSGTTNEKGEPAVGYDPKNDITFLEHEIDMWYFGILKKGWDKFARQTKSNNVDIDKALSKQMSSFKVKDEMVQDAMNKLGLGEDPTLWTDEQLKDLAKDLRKKTKPIVVACNKIDLPGAEENYNRLKKEMKEHMLVPCSAVSELALREAAKKKLIKYNPGDKSFTIISQDMNEKQKAALNFIKNNILDKYGSTGVQNVLDSAVFDFLKYIAIFPGGISKLMDSEGRVLPDCFLLPSGSTVYDFAAKIHTDLAKNILYGMDVRKRMKLSKDHPLKHRDVIEIISAAK